jgi:hypothetical protein
MAKTRNTLVNQKILVTVCDGIAKAVESTVQKGIKVEVIDYDAIEQYGRRTFNRLSETARTFALTDRPTLLRRFKNGK